MAHQRIHDETVIKLSSLVKAINIKRKEDGVKLMTKPDLIAEIVNKHYKAEKRAGRV